MAIRLFENYPEITALISTREDGDMLIKKDAFGDAIKNPYRSAFFHSYQIPEEQVIWTILEHQNRVVIVNEGTKSGIYGDALAANLKNKFLSITAADCYPIYLYDKAIGLAHGGIKPLVEGVLLSTVSAMESIGANRKNIIAAVGPGICQRCYDWQREDLYKLKKYNDPKYILEVLDNKKKVRIDIEGIIRDQLKEAGIENVTFSRKCTCCRPKKYFSNRRGDKERMLAVIGMAG